MDLVAIGVHDIVALGSSVVHEELDGGHGLHLDKTNKKISFSHDKGNYGGEGFPRPSDLIEVPKQFLTPRSGDGRHHLGSRRLLGCGKMETRRGSSAI